MRKELVRKSRFLSLVLRHDPAAAGVALDAQGWVAVGELLRGAADAGVVITPEELLEIVQTNEKRRFLIDDTGERIRANQGHSVQVDVDLAVATPPAQLFHGTATRFVEAIEREGLKPMGRLHVHLSADVATARQVGARHGRPYILVVDAGGMVAAGRMFWRSANGVWLTADVPPQFLSSEAVETA
ncbi:RNA 2'-phosphotransferase [Actomonas aquatica]